MYAHSMSYQLLICSPVYADINWFKKIEKIKIWNQNDC